MHDTNKYIAKLFRDFKVICDIYEYLMELFVQDKDSLEKYFILHQWD